MPDQVTVKVPATTANLGPGFDTLGLALDLWNQAHVRRTESGVKVDIEGHGKGILPRDGGHLTARAALMIFELAGLAIPGLHIQAQNGFPTRSGLGSSASAIVLGLLAGNVLAGSPFTPTELLDLAIRLEDHPDNVTPAIVGGLTISAATRDGNQFRKLDLPTWHVGVVVPSVQFTTAAARAGLPERVPLAQAVGSIGRTALVVQALCNGDQTLLRQCMEDHLHQPHRLKFIPGGQAALTAAQHTGAAAALSGSGPGLIALADQPDIVARAVKAMTSALNQAGLSVWSQCLRASLEGARLG